MSKKLKTLIACLILTLCFMFTACVSDPASFYFNYDELKESVVAVELINYDNPDAKWVKRKNDVLPFYFDKMEIVETLETEAYENFFQELPEIHFHIADDLTKYINSASGLSIRIVYASGDFIICSNTNLSFLGEFNADGSVGELVGYLIDAQDFSDLVNKYFSTQID